jgi:DNA-binding transcriptional ArsR family regulator
VVNKQARLTSIFAALAHPVRRRILERLSPRRQMRVTALAKPFRMSLPAISKHLVVLERATLVTRERSGREHLIRPNAAGLKEAREWLARHAAVWDVALDALDHVPQNERRKDEP